MICAQEIKRNLLKHDFDCIYSVKVQKSICFEFFFLTSKLYFFLFNLGLQLTV